MLPNVNPSVVIFLLLVDHASQVALNITVTDSLSDMSVERWLVENTSHQQRKHSFAPSRIFGSATPATLCVQCSDTPDISVERWLVEHTSHQQRKHSFAPSRIFGSATPATLCVQCSDTPAAHNCASTLWTNQLNFRKNVDKQHRVDTVPF